MNGFTTYSSPNALAAAVAAGGGNTTANSNSSTSGRNGFTIQELPESSSPLSVSNIHFDEDIGPIPPPKMFSDIRLNAITVQLTNGQNDQNDKNSTPSEVPRNDNDSLPRTDKIREKTRLQMDGKVELWTRIAQELSAMGFEEEAQQMNYDSDLDIMNLDYDEWNSPLVEKIPAKEPQLSAVPKKSAMKKPKFIVANNSEPISNG